MNNTMILCGKLWKDAETKTIGGYNYDSFSLPLSSGVKNTDGTLAKTPFVQILRRQSDKGPHPLLKKGAAVEIIGNLTAGAWLGNNGKPGLDLTLWCNNVNFIGMVTERNEESIAINTITQAINNNINDNDDLPF